MVDQRADNSADRVGAILEAVSFSAEQFMKEKDWELAVHQMLERLGKAAKMSRVYIFQDELGCDGILYSSQKYEWHAQDIEPQINNPELQNISLRSQYPEWEKSLSQSQPILCIVQDLPKYEQALLVAQDIKSMAIFPILVEHLHWGHIGFDDCILQREWSQPEIEALKAAAGILGASIERKLAVTALSEKNLQLAELTRRLVDIQETDKHYLALELHDEIGQDLTGIRLTLELGRKLSDLEQVREKITQTLEMVEKLADHVRNISNMLRPNFLDDLGLLPALLWLFENYTSQTGIQVSIQHNGLSGRRLKPEIEITVYRLVQEMLTNVARHSGAAHVEVMVWVSSNLIRVKVEDNGKGFDVTTLRPGHTGIGLSGISERIGWLGGVMNIESTPGSGTCITAEIALDGSSPPDFASSNIDWIVL
jgi:signal transduction histidine kinase